MKSKLMEFPLGIADQLLETWDMVLADEDTGLVLPYDTARFSHRCTTSSLYLLTPTEGYPLQQGGLEVINLNIPGTCFITGPM